MISGIDRREQGIDGRITAGSRLVICRVVWGCVDIDRPIKCEVSEQAILTNYPVYQIRAKINQIAIVELRVT